MLEWCSITSAHDHAASSARAKRATSARPSTRLRGVDCLSWCSPNAKEVRRAASRTRAPFLDRFYCLRIDSLSRRSLARSVRGLQLVRRDARDALQPVRSYCQPLRARRTDATTKDVRLVVPRPSSLPTIASMIERLYGARRVTRGAWRADDEEATITAPFSKSRRAG